MSILEDALSQTCTYWPGTRTRTGGVVYGAPQVTRCRWERKLKLVRDREGHELVSQARVFLPVDPGYTGRIAQGDRSSVANPATLADSFEVAIIEDMIGFDGETEGYVAWLR